MTFIRRIFRNIFGIKPKRTYPATFIEGFVTTSDKKCGRCPYNVSCSRLPSSDCQYAYEERNFQPQKPQNNDVFN